MSDLQYYRLTIPETESTTVQACKGCHRLIPLGQLDTDGHGPCCRRAVATDESRLAEALQKAVRYKNLLQEERAQRKDERAAHETHLATLRGRIEAKDEAIRVLQLANRSLGDARTEAMRDLLAACLAWREAIEKLDGIVSAEDRLKAALRAVEEAGRGDG